MSLARSGLLATLVTVAAPHHGAIAAKLFDHGPVCTTPEAVEPAEAAWLEEDLTALRRFDCIALTESDLQVRSLRCGQRGPDPDHEAWIRFYGPAQFDPALPAFICEVEVYMFGRKIRLYTNFHNVLWGGETLRRPPTEHEADTPTTRAITHMLTTLFFLEPSDLSLEIPPRRVVQSKLRKHWPVCTTPEAVEPAEAAWLEEDLTALRRLDCIFPSDSDLQVRVLRCGSFAKTPRQKLWMRVYYPVEFDLTLPQDVCEIEAAIPDRKQTRLYTDITNILWHS